MDFVENIRKNFPIEVCDKLLSSLEKENTHAVLLNTKKMSNDKFLSLFPNCTKHPIVKNAYLYNKNEYDLGKSLYHELGCFYLQDPSAMSVAGLLDINENDVVLDMCAAPGGKTIQVSFKLNDTGLIIANDISHSRCSAILSNVERLGLGNIVITNNDMQSYVGNLSNSFDKIILDAPCSGSGMFRKNDLVKNDWNYNKVIKFQEIQKDLILKAYDMLKPGGVLCYSTCSFSKEENEDVIQHLINNSNCELVNIGPIDNLYKPNEGYGAYFLPCYFEGEGQYCCLIKKPGKSSVTSIKRKELNYGNAKFIGYESNLLNKMSIIRNGVKVGETNKNIFKYEYHYSKYVASFENVLDINLEQLQKYYMGETIPYNKKGYILLRYDSINVDIAKCDGVNVKNYLPKGLRKKIY